MALTKYMTQPVPAGGDLRRYIDAEYRKIQRSTDSIIDTTSTLEEALASQDTRIAALEAVRPIYGMAAMSLRGSGTAGTYQLALGVGHWTRIGRRVWLDIRIALASSVTGGGTGYMQIVGAPFTKANDTFPWGGVRLYKMSATADHRLNMEFITAGPTTVLYCFQVAETGLTGIDFPISSAIADTTVVGSISYETDDAYP
jgi:hypothetical protein